MKDKLKGTSGEEQQPVATATGALADAVEAADLLLAYAAEHIEKLTSETITAIVASKHILAERTLSDEEESVFWHAYHDLCLATAPVSPESLEATTMQAGRAGFRRNSQAQNAVRNYQFMTLLAMFCLLIGQVYWVYVGTLSSDLERTKGEITKIESELFKLGAEENQLYELLHPPGLKTEQITSPSIPEAERKAAEDRMAQIEQEVRILSEVKLPDLRGRQEVNERLLKKVNFLARAYGEYWEFDSIYAGSSDSESAVSPTTFMIQTGTITYDLMALYVLPIFYGWLGACAYVLRSISNQVRMRIFTRATKIQLNLRIVLGALAGLSIAWFVKTGGGEGLLGNITGLALAFLAGYSVELLFSAMDALIGAFSRDNPAVPGERGGTR